MNHLEPLQTRTMAETRSFRLDSGSLAALRDDSKRFRVSVNTLLNQILALYARKEGSRRYLELVSELGEVVSS